jgi:hypothetical protein
VLNAGEGQIVTSDVVEAVVRAVVAPTDCVAELPNVHDELDRAETGSMSAVEVNGVLSSGESVSLAEMGRGDTAGLDGDDHGEVAGGQIVTTTGDWVDCAAVSLLPTLGHS